MGLRILSDTNASLACLYSSSTDWAFGPVFSSDKAHEADERAEAFLRWLKRDPRTLTDSDLSLAYSDWLGQEAAQWQAEADAEQAKWAAEEA